MIKINVSTPGAVPKARPKGAQQHGCLIGRFIARMTCYIGEFVFVVQIESPISSGQIK